MEHSDWLRRSDWQLLLPVMDRSLTGSGLHQQVFRACFANDLEFFLFIHPLF